MPPTSANDPLRTTDPVPNAGPPGSEVTTDHSPDSSSIDGATATYLPGQGAKPGGTESEPGPASVSIPGYEIEAVLGRGGMGVVYKARHLALKRTVALKMVLAGGHAGPRELAGFRIEAEAAARLQHPNIVQIHEVGEAGGRPYCALEFVEGGNLADRIDGKPLPARESARLVETLTRAMQRAHSRNVVHRDLKPANILLTADGTPKITDFGLARQMDSDSGETQAGAVMGTPSYMAPEQAAGQAHEAGPPADVYALGAILYACLTGRPPFKGKTIAETLDKVRTQEPAPPSRCQAGVPLDLDTVCLKCLRKEPENRYASAAELADDLGRHLRGEPVQARPVGRVERGWRWCRRNPVLALAAGTVVVVLATASVVSTLFGIDAGKKEAAAVAARNDLATKNTELEQSQAAIIGKNTEIVKKNTALEQSQDQLEGALARTWLSPLAEAPGPLTDAEIGAFTDLASVGNDRLGERFVAEALGSRQEIRKLRARSEFALQAVVGLDARKRREVERLLVGALETRDLPDESRADVALAVTALGELSPPAGAAAAHALLHALHRTNVAALGPLAQGLSAAAAGLEPAEAARVFAEAADRLTQAMTRTNDPNSLGSLAQGLSAVAARLEPAEAAKAAAALATAMARTNQRVALRLLADGLSAAAARLEPGEAAKAAATLTQAMTSTNDSFALSFLARGVSAATARLAPKEAVAMLTQAMAYANNSPSALQYLAQGLSEAAARLQPEEAADVAATLAQTITRTNDSPGLIMMARGLSAVAAHLEPAQAATAAAVLTQTMTRTNNPTTLWSLARILSEVTTHLEPEEAARVSAEAADRLTRAMTSTDDPGTLGTLAQALWSAGLPKPEQAAEVADRLTRAMTSAKDPNALGPLAYGLFAAAARLEPTEAARVSAQAADRLTQAMTRTNDPGTLGSLAKGLAAGAARLRPAQAAKAAAVLTQTMARTKDPNTLWSLGQGLSAVTAHLEPEEAAKAAAALNQAMARADDPVALQVFAQGLSAAAARLEPAEAARVSAEAADRLSRAMANGNNSNNSDHLSRLAQGLSAAAAGLEPREAAAALTQAIAKTTDPTALQYLAEGLSVAAARLGPAEAARVSAEAADRLTQAMAGTNDPNALGSLAQGLSAVAARLEPAEAAKAAAALATTMTRTNEPYALVPLAQNLSAILGDGRPRERTWALTAAVGYLHDGQGLLGALALLQPAAEPFPHRLSDQQLMELLKQPLCVGLARRAILDHLEYRYKRPFADQWDFVRFAEAQKLGLDFTRPPQRP